MYRGFFQFAQLRVTRASIRAPLAWDEACSTRIRTAELACCDSDGNHSQLSQFMKTRRVYVSDKVAIPGF